MKNFNTIIIFALLSVSIFSEDVKLDKEGKFKLSYVVSQLKITFTTTFSALGFIGVGFKDDMVGQDILVVEWRGGDDVKVDDYWAADFGRPVLDTKLGGSSDVFNIKIVKLSNNQIEVTFDRYLLTKDSKYDFQLGLNTKVKSSAAWLENPNGLNFHGNNVVFFDINIRNSIE